MTIGRTASALPRGPRVCNGFLPGTHGKWGMGWAAMHCPDGYAVYANDDPGIAPKTAAHVLPSYTCCPLPADDILTSEHRYEEASCPEGFVITGGAPDNAGVETGINRIRCTKINATRYQLGQRAPAWYWGLGWSMFDNTQWSSRARLPASIRHAVGRVSLRAWDIDGCIGDPPGSLWVSKGVRICENHHYQQLQYRGLPGDPPRGTAVPMFPNCAAVTSQFEADTRCVK